MRPNDWIHARCKVSRAMHGYAWIRLYVRGCTLGRITSSFGTNGNSAGKSFDRASSTMTANGNVARLCW